MRLLSGHNIHPLRMAGHTGNNIPAGASMLFHGFFQSRKDSIASRLSKNQIDEKCHSIFYEQANLFRSFKCRTRSLWAVSLCGRCICSNRTESQHDFLLFQMWTSFFFISMPFFSSHPHISQLHAACPTLIKSYSHPIRAILYGLNSFLHITQVCAFTCFWIRWKHFRNQKLNYAN